MLSAFLCVVEIVRKAHSWLLYNFYIVFTGTLGSLLSLVRPSIDMKDCTQTVMFSENGRVFPTCIYGQVLEKKSKLTGSSCCHKWTTAVCTSAIQCPLSIFFSLFLLLLTPVDRKSLPNDTNGNGTSLNWGCFSIYTSLVSHYQIPLTWVIQLEVFRVQNFYHADGKAAKILRLLLKGFIPSTESLCIRRVGLFPLEYKFLS